MQVISGTYDLTAAPYSPGYAPATVEGIAAHDFETVEQDFLLYPYCPLFTDDVEEGNQGWLADAPWAITGEASHSPSHSWTDSPGGVYSNNRDVSLTSPVLDLSGNSAIRLSYWQICDTETGYDFCQVEISDDGGDTWSGVASFDGPHFTWENISLELPDLDGQEEARIRFRFTSDGSLTDDGWHLDDVHLEGAGPGCISIVAPTAGFTSSSPDLLGETTQFTNTSTGTDLDYAWDFGDGTGIITETHPSHAFLVAGSYTVTLTATNDVGSSTHSSTVEIVEVPSVYYFHFLPVIRQD
jgi:hypothetical protein